MLRSMLLLLLLTLTPQPAQQHSDAANPATDDAPADTSDGQLKMPSTIGSGSSSALAWT
jgi:hypothetical protein